MNKNSSKQGGLLSKKVDFFLKLARTLHFVGR
jgi:hypothetical protein